MSRNKFPALFAALVLAARLALPACAAEAEPAPHWRFDIDTGGAEGYVELLLPPELYTHAAEGLRNLRVADGDGAQVAYVLYDELREEDLVSASFAGHYISQYEKDGNLYMDFELEREEGHDVYGNSLTLETDNQNFAKRMVLQGSHDSIAWTNVISDTLYRVDGNERLTFYFSTIVKFPYYRISLPNNKEAIRISSVELRYTAGTSAQSRFLQTIEVPFELEQKEFVNETSLTVGTIAGEHIRNLPLTAFELHTNSMFQRRVQLQRHRADADYGIVTYADTAMLYNLPFQELVLRNTTIEMGGDLYDGLAFVIDNGNDTPLEIEGVSLTYSAHKLLFRAEAGVQYHLLLGDPGLPAPSYDIAGYLTRILEYEPISAATAAAPQQIVVAPPEEPKGPDGKLFLNLAVGAASILLVALIGRSLVRQKGQEDGGQ